MVELKEKQRRAGKTEMQNGYVPYIWLDISSSPGSWVVLLLLKPLPPVAGLPPVADR